jgi:flagellar basal-body rod protein FlgB
VDLFDTTQLALGAAMRGATVRQQTLAGNLANVDTPGYVRKDVDFHDALRAAVSSATTPPASFDAMTFTPADDAATPMRADGNSVDVDTESAALSQNALEYQSLAQVARTRIEILQSAMGAG